MGNLVVSEFVSLDGVMEAPDTWNLPYASQEMADVILDDLLLADALLYGRTTFAVMAAAWPGRSGPLADRFNGLPKYVLSSTLESSEWNQTTILRGPLATEVAVLKSRTARALMVWGSGRLVHSLMQHRLIDEYRLFVHPIVLGRGIRLFPEGGSRQPASLSRVRTLASGVVVLSYVVGAASSRNQPT